MKLHFSTWTNQTEINTNEALVAVVKKFNEWKDNAHVLSDDFTTLYHEVEDELDHAVTTIRELAASVKDETEVNVLLRDDRNEQFIAARCTGRGNVMAIAVRDSDNEGDIFIEVFVDSTRNAVLNWASEIADLYMSLEEPDVYVYETNGPEGLKPFQTFEDYVHKEMHKGNYSPALELIREVNESRLYGMGLINKPASWSTSEPDKFGYLASNFVHWVEEYNGPTEYVYSLRKFIVSPVDGVATITRAE